MSQSTMTEAEARQARLLCYVAAAVFGGCALLLLLIPASLPVRAVAAGFNGVVTVAVLLYARTLRGAQPPSAD
jgi:hypothetical protein